MILLKERSLEKILNWLIRLEEVQFRQWPTYLAPPRREGFHRNSKKNFMGFLDYSRSSIAETISHTYVALDQEYIEQNDLTEAKQLADVVWK